MGSMESFVDELLKIAVVAELGEKALPILKQYGKPAALVGGGALGYHFGKKELDKYLLGRRVYEQMQGQGG